MKTKKFHIGDVLSVVTTLNLSICGVRGVSELLKFMARQDVFDVQSEGCMATCKPYLIQQFPYLDSPEMHFAIAELRLLLKTPNGRKDPKHLLVGWFSKLTSGGYGVKCDEQLMIKPLPKGVYKNKGVFEDLAKEIAKT